jgi:fructuronate reductase
MARSGDTSWAICGVTQRSPAVANMLVPQDCLYSVTERDLSSTRTTVITAVRDVLFAQEQWDLVLRRLADPAISVVTTTVSEKGYHLGPADRRLRKDDPAVLSDAQGGVPRTVVGQLVTGLEARRQANGAPVNIVCCDNLPNNGGVLREAVYDFCELMGHDAGAPLVAWMNSHVAFPSTVVDRIVPATTDADREMAREKLGLQDLGAVVTEPFSQWVVEDSFVGRRPPWGQAGMVLVADVAPYEEMKLRLLNGSHSALAYLGGLAGYELVSDACASDDFVRFTRGFMDVDVTPTLRAPSGFDMAEYKGTLLDRFANPALRHRTAQIAMDGSQKLPYRLLSTVRARLSDGQEPRHASLAVAAWMRYVSAGADDLGRALPLEDPLADRVRAVLVGTSTPASVASALLGLTEIFPPDVAENDTFRALVTDALRDLGQRGAAQVVRGLVT